MLPLRDEIFRRMSKFIFTCFLQGSILIKRILKHTITAYAQAVSPIAKNGCQVVYDVVKVTE
jgi:hypothetical protein